MNPVKAAFEDGAMAYLCGFTENDCPYVPQARRLYAAWRMGWMAAKRNQGH